MGRSFLSIRLAAVFGLLVAGGVTAQERMMERRLETQVEAVAEQAVARERCDQDVNGLAHTPRATARAPRAGAAARS
jgi:hypothetical protein